MRGEPAACTDRSNLAVFERRTPEARVEIGGASGDSVAAAGLVDGARVQRFFNGT
jgi:hypothetical protein